VHQDLVRFYRYVAAGPNGCHIWTAATNPKGYGIFKVDGRSVLAHRFAKRHRGGTVPAGLELDHLCRVRRCVNPAHLEMVTHAENVRRGDAGKWQA
jgi:HNH endonuclease